LLDSGHATACHVAFPPKRDGDRRFRVSRKARASIDRLAGGNIVWLRANAIVMLRAFRRAGLESFQTYEGPVQKSLRYRIGLVGWRWRLVVALTRAITLGLLSGDEASQSG
jgi:hypothetical protein